MYCDGNPLAMVGNIPAYAGNTLPSHGCKRTSRDHPRLRGEHILVESGDVRSMGSSPLARGTLAVDSIKELAERIIPACAGNTTRKRTSTRPTQDHPRLRGEHDGSRYRRLKGPGSSPLARGTRDRQGVRVAFPGSSPLARGTQPLNADEDRPLGIIPACAGNTRCIYCIQRRSWDHPRLRGEHLSVPPSL